MKRSYLLGKNLKILKLALKGRGHWDGSLEALSLLLFWESFFGSFIENGAGSRRMKKVLR